MKPSQGRRRVTGAEPGLLVAAQKKIGPVQRLREGPGAVALSERQEPALLTSANGLGRPLLSSLLSLSGLTEANGLRHFRARLGVVRRDHRVVERQ